MAQVKKNMRPFSIVTKSIRGHSVVVTVSGKTKETLAHTDVIQVWGTNIDKELIKAIQN